MRPTLTALALAAVLPWGAATAQGDEQEQKRTYYEVELVVFENLGTHRDRTQERWDPVIIDPRFDGVAQFAFDGTASIAAVLASQHDSSDASDDGEEDWPTDWPIGRRRAGEASAPPPAFQALAREDGTLGGAVKRLADSGRYRVLRHVRWRQPPTAPAEATPLRFTAGERLSLSVPERGYRRPRAMPTVNEAVEPVAQDSGDDAGASSDTTLVDDRQGTEAGAGRSAEGAPGRAAPKTPFGSGMHAARRRQVTVRALDGTVTLVVSRYLHLHADLHYTKAVDWREEVGGGKRVIARETASEGDSEQQGEGVRRGRVAMPRDSEGQAVLTYPFEQRRRMRSGELHYLDHPVLGMLVLIEPRELTPAKARSSEPVGPDSADDAAPGGG